MKGERLGRLSSGGRVRFLSHSFCLTLNCCTKVLSLFCWFAGCSGLFVVVWRLSILQPSLFWALCMFFLYIYTFCACCFSTFAM